jgi:hypothetical protein
VSIPVIMNLHAYIAVGRRSQSEQWIARAGIAAESELADGISWADLSER